MAQRQTRIYGTILAVLAVLFLLGLLGLFGILPMPFGNEFSKKIDYASNGTTPCPSENGVIVGPGEGVNVQVLNASSVSGLAGHIGTELEDAGYNVPVIDNSPKSFKGNVQIEAGPDGVDYAYTIAQFFDPPVRIKLQPLGGKTINIVLGEGFHGNPTAEKIEEILASKAKLTPLANCKPVKSGQENPADEQSGQQSEQQSGDDQSADADEGATKDQ